jgi:hypothetical protein
MSASEDFVEVNVHPVGQDSAFGIELRVQDSSLNPQPFVITLGFQMEDGQVPGLNEDAANQPEEVIELAKNLLLCDSDEMPPLIDIPSDECPVGQMGYYYGLDTEMEFETQGQVQVKMQQWQISIFQSPLENPLDRQRLFRMVQEFFSKHL